MPRSYSGSLRDVLVPWPRDGESRNILEVELAEHSDGLDGRMEIRKKSRMSPSWGPGMREAVMDRVKDGACMVSSLKQPEDGFLEQPSAHGTEPQKM